MRINIQYTPEEAVAINFLKTKATDRQLNYFHTMIAHKSPQDRDTILFLHDAIKQLVTENFLNGLIALALVGAELSKEFFNHD